ncbi:GNAT family N-acetyltransferase [Nocardioides massiliensis]|uniref:RimJ/RimL family protein N-acetyltransferase n=1 Tax=Nocardioides massiliensis TaxID=1325935 RepID=A0ABT9NTQ0_9ACTN|nr:GNAT family protein [Nocardioides massiliensis]MDP9823783.1 RimJ/RimL family protein N-acetyltransferase [Nocardioides massiliensis]
MELAEIFPPLGLHITCGDLALVGITDDLLPRLGEAAAAGIHDPEAMPFLVPWTDAPAEELPTRIATYQWSVRAAFAPESWALELAVLWRGEVIGIQAVAARDFAVCGSVSTGSWLGRAHQGQGIGTRMRQVACAFAFDHLGARQVTSSAFADNAASLRVSEKVGYRLNGTSLRERRAGECAVEQHLLLLPDDLVRPPEPLVVTGVEPVRRLLGLARDRMNPPQRSG